MVEVKGEEVGTRTRRVGLSDGLIFDGHRLRTAKQIRICDRLMRLLMRHHIATSGSAARHLLFVAGRF